MRYRFGTFSLVVLRRELRRGDELVPIEPRVFDLLHHLIMHRDRVIGSEELVAEVWHGRVISDASIASCVRSARRALGDSGRAPSYIRTMHRRGFRFIAEVLADDVEASGDVKAGARASSPAARVRPEREGSRAARSDSLAPPPPGNEDPHDDADTLAELDLSLPRQCSIAVLSIEVLAGDEGQTLLARGLTDDLSFGLACSRWLFVSARESAARFDLATRSPHEIGRRLGVRYLLGGSIHFSGKRFRYTAYLVDATTGSEVWAERFERRLDDLFAVQDEIGELVVAGVEAQIELRERRRAVLHPLEAPDAWNAYYRGLDLLYRYDPVLHAEADALLARAAVLEPAASRIAAARSFLCWQRAWMRRGPDGTGDYERAEELALHSVSLDPHDPQARWALGRVALYTGRAADASDELASAAELNPSFAKAHYAFGHSRMLEGHSSDTLSAVARARRFSPYDPMSFSFMVLRASAHLQLGQHDEAIAWARRGSRQPHIPYHVLAIAAAVLQRCGMHEEARTLIGRVRTLRDDYSIAEHLRAIPYPPALGELIGAGLRELDLP